MSKIPEILKTRMKITNFVGISNTKKTLMRMSAVAVVLAYLGYHAVSGDSGAVAYIRLKKIVAEKQAELDSKKDEFKSLEQKVKLLSDKTLDLDLLDERCRAINNLSDASDCIVKVY